jgi:acetyl-CoA carboxylase carboxyl transferase subunit alpha
LGIAIGDKVMMLENSWYSVISPENCSTILWRSWDHKEQAAEALKLTGPDMLKNRLIDAIIDEPLGGAHRNMKDMAMRIKEKINDSLAELDKVKADKRIQMRIDKFCAMGIVQE